MHLAGGCLSLLRGRGTHCSDIDEAIFCRIVITSATCRCCLHHLLALIVHSALKLTRLA